MADRSSIEWTDATWSPVTGCTRVSPGCDHCYIERTPPFRMAHRRFDKPGIGGTTGVQLHPERLEMPLRWRKPRRVFVNSLADLFHDQVPREFVARVFAIMALAGQHTFQVLTKRPARMRTLLSSDPFETTIGAILASEYRDRPGGAPWSIMRKIDSGIPRPANWPLSNCWLGVSIESDKHVGRADHLRNTPATVRFISAEPLLGPLPSLDLAGIDWLIVGGESGPGSRPMHPDWARSLRDQCQAAGVHFFFKQAGAVLAREWGCSDRNGHTPSEWPEVFPREHPNAA